MKKISTLSFGILFSLVSFAGVSTSRLTITAEGNANIKVTVDGSRFNQQSANSSVVFDNLRAGYHSVSVYQLIEKRSGIFYRGQTADYRLVYTASVNIKPMVTTTISLDRFNKAQIIEQSVRGAYTGKGWNNGRSDDRSYNNDRDRQSDYGRDISYDRNTSYSRTISNEDFFAAQRVMDRENDNGRLLYAKSVIDNNFLSAEQVKELARFFSFDNNRFDFIKYAYSKTTDKNNFSTVCSAFSSAGGRDQVMSFIKSCR